MKYRMFFIFTLFVCILSGISHAQIIISGTIRDCEGNGIAGVELLGWPGPNPQTDSQGYYYGVVKVGQSFQPTPSKDDLVFNPEYRYYDIPLTATGNFVNQDYVEYCPKKRVVIEQDLQDETVELGKNAQFKIRASNAEEYRWYHNGFTLGWTKSPTFNIRSVRIGDVGEVWVEVRGLPKTLTSRKATLQITIPSPNQKK